MSFIEIFISIHISIIISFIFINRQSFLQNSSLKLFLLRILLLSCVLSPIFVYFAKPVQRSFFLNKIHLNNINKFQNNLSLNPIKGSTIESAIDTLHEQKRKINFVYLKAFILICFLFGSFYRIFFLIKDMKKLRSLLNSAQEYRKQGKIKIKVSDQCVVPFSVQFYRTAYIILPVSILNSPTNTKLAIAHEGQHHRQGDCLWAYFMEGIRIVFWGNPCLKGWQRVFNELQELACDESLVGHHRISAHDYGRCLFHVAQTASQTHSSYQKFACTAQMAWGCEKETESFITRRICMLSKYQLRRSYRVLGVIFAISATLGPLGIAYAAKGFFPQEASTNEIDTSSLDPKIQKIAMDEISTAVAQTHAKSGVIAVADAHTGKIIAFAESSNRMEINSWKSRIFNPASTIKPFVAAAAINSGVSSASQVYNCHEPYDVDGTQFTNGISNIDSFSMTEAMIKSVNICMIKVAQNTGSEQLRQTLSRFGFDMNSAWKNDRSDALNLAYIAQGSSIPVTIETLLKAFTILANNGHLLDENSHEAVSKETARSVTQMLEEAVKRGTGKRAGMVDTLVAGKTGTLSDAEQTTSLALFGGYVPAENPRFVSIVVMEDAYKKDQPQELASGGDVAAPVFHNVLEKSLNISK